MSILDHVPSPDKADANAEMCVKECDFQTSYPGLWEFLARQMYRGTARATGKLVFFTEPEKVTVCLIDRHTGQVAFFTAETVEEVLCGSDKALTSGTLDWRKDKKAAYRR